MSVADWNALYRKGRPKAVAPDAVLEEAPDSVPLDDLATPEPQGVISRTWGGLGRGVLQIGEGLGGGMQVAGNRLAATTPVSASLALGPAAGPPLAALGRAVGPSIESVGRNLTDKSQFLTKRLAPPSSLQDVVEGKVPTHEYLAENVAMVGPQMGVAAGIGVGAWAAGLPAGAATLAGGLFNYLINTGDVFNTLRERGVPADKAANFAGVAGVPIAWLDTLYLKGLLKPKAINGFMRRVADGFVRESFPEGGQELLAAATEWAAGVPDTVKNVLWRLAGSMVVGGAAGTLGAAAGHRGAKREETINQLVDSLGPLARQGAAAAPDAVPEGEFVPEGILKAPSGGYNVEVPPYAAQAGLGSALGPAAVPQPEWRQVMGEDREKLFVPSMEAGQIQVENRLTRREQAKADDLIAAGAPELDAYSSAKYGVDHASLSPERQMEIEKLIEDTLRQKLPTQNDVPDKGVIRPTVEINKPPGEAPPGDLATAAARLKEAEKALSVASESGDLGKFNAAHEAWDIAQSRWAALKYGTSVLGEAPQGRVMGQSDLQSFELKEGPAPTEESAKAAMVEAYDNVYQAREVIREIQVKMDTAIGEEKTKLSVQLEKARRMLAEADAMAIESARLHQKMAREGMEERRAKEAKEQAERISPSVFREVRPAVESALNVLANSNSTDEETQAAWDTIAAFKILAKQHNINPDLLLQEWEDKLAWRDTGRHIARRMEIDNMRPAVQDALRVLADPASSDEDLDAAGKVMGTFLDRAQKNGEDAEAILKDWGMEPPAESPPGEGDDVYTQGPQDRQEFLELLYGKGQVPGQPALDERTIRDLEEKYPGIDPRRIIAQQDGYVIKDSPDLGTYNSILEAIEAIIGKWETEFESTFGPGPKSLTEEEQAFFGGLGAPKVSGPVAEAQSRIIQAEVRAIVAEEALRTASPETRGQRKLELADALRERKEAGIELTKAKKEEADEKAKEKRKGGGPRPQMAGPRGPKPRPDTTVNWTDVLKRRADTAAKAVQAAKAKLEAATTPQEKEIAGSALDQAIADWQQASQTLRAYDPAAEQEKARLEAKAKPRGARAKAPTPTAPPAPPAPAPVAPTPPAADAVPVAEAVVPEEEEDAEEEARRMAERRAERLAEMAKRAAAAGVSGDVAAAEAKVPKAPPTPTAPVAKPPAYTPPEVVDPEARPTAPYVSHSSEAGVPPIVFQPIDLQVVRENPLVAFGLDTTDAGTLGASLAQAIFEARTQAAARARISLAVEEARVKGLDGNKVAEAAIHLAQQIYPQLTTAEARQAAGPLTTAGPDRTVEKGTAAVAQALGITPKEAYAEARGTPRPWEAINRVRRADKLAEILYAFNVDPSRISEVSDETWKQVAQAAGVEYDKKKGISPDTRALVTRLLHGKGKEDASGPQKMISDEDYEQFRTDPNVRTYMEKWQGQNNTATVLGAWWKFKKRPGQSGTLYVNKATMDIIAHVMGDEAPDGYSFDYRDMGQLIEKLRDHEIKGLNRDARDRITSLRFAVTDHRKASGANDSLGVVLADEDVPVEGGVRAGAKEESAHAAQRYFPLKWETVVQLMRTPTFKKAQMALRLMHYEDHGPRFDFNEITAKALVGNPIGLTTEEQLEVVEAYADALVAEHGPDALAVFKYLKAGETRKRFYAAQAKAEESLDSAGAVEREGGEQLQRGATGGREGTPGGPGFEEGVSGEPSEVVGQEGINPQKFIGATRRWLARRRMLASMIPPGAQQDMSIGSWWLKQTKTVYQLAAMAPNYPPIQKLVKIMEGINNTKNWFLTQGEKVTKRWQSLSDSERVDLTRYSIAVHEQSKQLGRRLTIAELAAQPIQLNPIQQQLFKDTDDFLRSSIFTLQTALINRIRAQQRAGGGVSPIDTDLQTVLNENYFPTIGFGEYIVWDDSTNEAFRFDDKSERDTKMEQIRALGHTVRPDTLSAPELAFSGMPYKMVAALMESLPIDSTQKARVKAVAAKDASHKVSAYDAERAIAQFAQRMGNFTSKTMYRGQIEDTNVLAREYSNNLAASGVDNENATHMEKWIAETGQHILNPTSRFNALKALMFTKYFWMVPKQAAINVTQLMNTYAALSAYMGKGPGRGTGMAKAAVLMVRSMRDIREMFNPDPRIAGRLTMDEKLFLQEMEIRGLLDQTWAGNVAAVSHGSPIERALTKMWVPRGKARAGAAYVRRTNDFGLRMFSFTEEFNRRFTALTAYRAAKLQNSPNARTIAENIVRKTQGVYDLANVPKWARGKANFMYVFRSYIQNQLHFYRHEEGGFQAFLMFSMFTGLMGMPFAENIADVLDFLLTTAKRVGGYPEPKTDVRFWLQKFFNGIYDGASEVIMHGGSRAANSLVDVSGSMGAGNILPTEGLTKGLMGSMDKQRALLRIAEDAGGVTAGGAMDLIKASMTQDPDGMSFLREFLPKAVTGTMALARDVGDRQFQTLDGKKLIPIDLYDSWSQAEILAKFLGFNPARVSRERDAKFAHYEEVRYYETRRELALNSMLAALKVPEGQEPDKKKVDAAVEALERFNESVPPPYQWTPKQWSRSIMERMSNRAREDMGFPLQDQYVELSEARRKAFGLPPAGEQGVPLGPGAVAPEDAVTPMR